MADLYDHEAMQSEGAAEVKLTEGIRALKALGWGQMDIEDRFSDLLEEEFPRPPISDVERKPKPKPNKARG